jgi:hypothetical protein
VTERMEQLYLEDLRVPFHIDESAAEASVFQGLAVTVYLLLNIEGQDV